MIPIYICEDNKLYLDLIKDEINKHVLIQNYDMYINYATHNPKELLKHLNNTNGIYFLDVDLQNDEMNGFELGQEIRKLDSRGFIIFVTTYGELSFETFKYRLEALDYIIKDDSNLIRERIRYCLDSVQERILNQSDNNKEYYSIKVLNKIHNIEMNSIYAIETSTQKHRLLLTSENQQLEFFSNLNEAKLQLNDNFIRIHRSFIINKQKIKTIDLNNNTITLSNNQVCLVARSMKKKLVELI